MQGLRALVSDYNLNALTLSYLILLKVYSLLSLHFLLAGAPYKSNTNGVNYLYIPRTYNLYH